MSITISKIPRSVGKWGVRTGNNNISIMGNKIFDDLFWAVLDITISPVYPRMLRLEGRSEEIVPGSGHDLSSGSLSGISMSFFNILRADRTEILLDDLYAVEGFYKSIGGFLDSCNLRRENCECLVGRVSYEKSEVDKVMRIGQFGEEIEVIG